MFFLVPNPLMSDKEDILKILRKNTTTIWPAPMFASAKKIPLAQVKNTYQICRKKMRALQFKILADQRKN